MPRQGGRSGVRWSGQHADRASSDGRNGRRGSGVACVGWPGSGGAAGGAGERPRCWVVWCLMRRSRSGRPWCSAQSVVVRPAPGPRVYAWWVGVLTRVLAVGAAGCQGVVGGCGWSAFADGTGRSGRGPGLGRWSGGLLAVPSARLGRRIFVHGRPSRLLGAGKAGHRGRGGRRP